MNIKAGDIVFSIGFGEYAYVISIRSGGENWHDVYVVSMSDGRREIRSVFEVTDIFSVDFS